MRSIVSDPTSLIKYSIIGIIVIVYFLSPVDLIPDYLGLIGYLDDILVIIAFICGILRSFYSNFTERNELEFSRIRAE